MMFVKNLKLSPFVVKIKLGKVFANVLDQFKSFPGYKKFGLLKNAIFATSPKGHPRRPRGR